MKRVREYQFDDSEEKKDGTKYKKIIKRQKQDRNSRREQKRML
jgi:hypothetical protein